MDFSVLNSIVLDVFGDDPETFPILINGLAVQAIYDSRHFASENGQAGTSDLITTISVRTTDLPLIDDTTSFFVRGQFYRSWEARPDGQGMTTVHLELTTFDGFTLDFTVPTNSQYVPLI